MGGELAGKVAIVTGGASGLGRATAELFVAEGAKAVIADVDTDAGETTAKELGDGAAFLPTDVSDADAVQACVDFTVERFGGLHVMFNNAGVGGSQRRFLQDDLRDFPRVMGVNLFGVITCTQRAARHMAEHGGGSIINTASIAGINAGGGVIAYRAAKAAVIHFSRCAAVDVAEYGVRVNCLAPAHIATAINTDYNIEAIVRLMQPLPRLGTPADVAQAALYLASDRSAQVTGIVLPVDGGTTAGPPMRPVKEVAAKPE